jgi:hypothetical protein
MIAHFIIPTSSAVPFVFAGSVFDGLLKTVFVVAIRSIFACLHKLIHPLAGRLHACFGVVLWVVSGFARIDRVDFLRVIYSFVAVM